MMSTPLLLFLSFHSIIVTLAVSPLKGNEEAVRSLMDRVLPPGASRHFMVSLHDGDCAVGVAPPCFVLQDNEDGRLAIEATTASELTAGLGHYLRHYCNMTIGWPRGGGSNIFIPKVWPSVVQGRVAKRRNTPFSYLMNVCIHSYSLVWYSWEDWENFIDWMALSGINLMLAMTGQEEVQYKVFRKLGLQDADIRNWFNGPALLTWSRGQNEYGSGILGTLPRWWMKDQWNLQRKILPRLRSLGIIGQLPGFQGNVPIQLKKIYNDTNITKAGATGWMDSLDPLFGKIADLWMETLIEDFGTDHWYQLDGYFDGSTAPWFQNKLSDPLTHPEKMTQVSFDAVERDVMAYRRAVAAYSGLNRTDPEAIWSFQGFAVIGWSTPKQAAVLKGFMESTQNFVVIDMDWTGKGQWKQFNNSAFFGAKFVWTTLHNFGGTDGLKGDLKVLNKIPFAAPTNAIGTGATPEGIDQNTAYYEFIFDQNFRDAPVPDLIAHLTERAHRRYGISSHDANIDMAWSLLAESVYSIDLSTQDNTGVAHLPPRGESPWFEADRKTPTATLCRIFESWRYLIQFAEESSSADGIRKEPFVYDLINTGREVLANLATPAGLNFSDAFSQTRLDRSELLMTGNFYIDLLRDLDTLVGTDEAFLVGPWIESARRLGVGRSNCSSAILGNVSCEDYMEWNARTQLTTWNPTPKGSRSIPGGPIDYAAKHWSGLIRDYYVKRAEMILKQALKHQVAGLALNTSTIEYESAKLAYKWTTATNKYPTKPMDDPVTVSRLMHDKYEGLFSSCTGQGVTVA